MCHCAIVGCYFEGLNTKVIINETETKHDEK
jgi:hypothetical protein